MTTRNQGLLGIAFLLFLPLQLLLGQAPSGIVTFSFDNATPVWDLSGGLTFNQSLIGAGGQETPISFSLDLAQDARGKLTSPNSVTLVQVGNDSIAAHYTVVGSVHGGGGRPARASITVVMDGEDFVAGVSTRFKINVHFTLEASTEELAFVGRASGNAVFKGLSSARIKSDVSVALPGGMDGSWTAQMNIIALRSLGGSALIILSNGKQVPTRLTGSYSARSALANVKLTGINEGLGTSANLKFISSAEGIELQSVRGSVLGQTVRP
jgi:hypothetical protein